MAGPLAIGRGSFFMLKVVVVAAFIFLLAPGPDPPPLEGAGAIVPAVSVLVGYEQDPSWSRPTLR